MRGVLLDIDGTLIDSNNGHAHAWVDALAEHGFDVPFERVRRMIGMGGDKVLDDLTGLSKESPQGREISERRKVIFRERYLPAVRPLPGTRPLLEHLRKCGLALVVATSAQGEEANALLEAAGVSDLIQAQTSSSDVAHSKPDPDIVQAALAQLDGHPEAAADKTNAAAVNGAIMLGDTPYDVQAAARADVGIIALRSGGWQDHDLAGALAVYDDPADLLAHFAQSPLAANGGGDDGDEK